MRGKKQRTDLQAYSFKLKLKDGEKFLDKPEFAVSKREGDKYVELPERETEISGNILGVEPKEYVYNKQVIRSYMITMQDQNEIYFINIPFNMLGRGLANSLLSLKSFNDISVSLYATKPKVEGGKSYPAASLRQNGELIKWKFSLDEMPKPDEVTFKGAIQRDWTKLEVFLAEHLKDLNKVIKSSVPASVSPTQEVEPSTDGQPDKDDVPF